MSEFKNTEWQFDFCLSSSKDNEQLPSSKCEELMETIIEWAEKNECHIGGGFTETNQK